MGYFGVITGSVVVTQGLFVDGLLWNVADKITYSADFTSLEAKMITSGHYLDNRATVPATVYLNTVCNSGDNCNGIDISTDTVGLSTTWSWVSGANADASLSGNTVTLIADGAPSETPWVASEARIVINAKDVGITTLSDLQYMSWDVDVNSGYIAHVDVYLDTNEDGDYDSGIDDVLVFEAAKVDPTICDAITTSYPTGDNIDTLGRGIINSDAHAWLSSGLSGGCITPNFLASYGPLSDWQSSGGKEGNTYKPNEEISQPYDIDGDTLVLRFEIEVDGWIANSKSVIGNIVINSVPVEMKILTNPVVVPSGSIQGFYINSKFPKMLVPDTYTITTEVALA